MPPRNTIKNYYIGCYYHIYNRGVEKRDIFLDQSDYHFFINRMRENLGDNPNKNHSDNVELGAFCLMPNHFHMILQNKSAKGIEGFMRSSLTSYSLYFNRKYNRVGHLFQSCYKASLLKGEGQLLIKSRYIHRNPLDLGADLKEYPYSNYKDFLLPKGEQYFNTRIILDLIGNKPHRYSQFVEND